MVNDLPDGPPDGHDVNARAGTVWLDGIDHTPDEAVDLARALLAAAEEARAEAAERELADEYSEANQKAAAWDRVAAHPALKMDLLPEADHTYAGGVFERITWLAEAAGARTAPTVTRKLVYDAVGAVYDVNGRRGPWPGVEPITDAVCHLFGIETAPDPVETLAVQIEDATRRAVRQACETLAPVAAGLNPEVIEEMMDITEASRRLARHVLGKEARDGVDR